MLKFGRNYKCSIQTQDGNTLEVTLPFTIEFDITRNTLTSANVCQIRLYNLSAQNRNQIFFNSSNVGTNRTVELKAGYGSNLATVFSGNISEAWSLREGTNFITQIECFDGGFAFVNGNNVSVTFPAGTPFLTVIQTLMGKLPNVTIGAIGNYPGVLLRSNTYSGNAAQLLFEITGGGFFIDNGKAYALGTNEYVPQPGIVTTVSPASGLLGTPQLERTTLRFEMLFEPSLNVGSLVLVQSSTINSNFSLNAPYKLTSIKHRGMISGAVSGNATTIGEFFFSKINLPATVITVPGL